MKLSIIIPIYNSASFIGHCLDSILTQKNSDIEIILVDDGSKDNTSNIMKNLAEKDDNIKYVIFSRNFGKESAMYAGLEKSKGDYVAVMDVDLQDPPEQLQEMLQSIKEEGYDCVATRRVTRKGEPKIRSWFARQFYKLINKWSQTEVVDGARDYRLMRRSMVDSILSLKEYNRFSKGIFSWVGYKTKWLEYENIERCAGETKWNFKKLFVYAIEGFLSFTLQPLYALLKLAGGLLVLDVIATLVLTVFEILFASGVTNTHVFHSWVILLLSMVALTAIIIGSLGIMGLYQAKIYSEIKQRPIYIAKDTNTK